MKRLGIYISSTETLKYINAEALLDIKIQYWVIKEIFLSPYAVYLNKLSPEKFLNKYLLAKEYVNPTEETLEDFVNYLIKILRNELDTK